jgi:transcription elongation factor Elf1
MARVTCIRCGGTSVRIISVDDKAALVECLSCGREFPAKIRAAAETVRRQLRTKSG